MTRPTHYDLQERLDAAFVAELIADGRDPAMVLSEQAAVRRPAQDAALRAAFAYCAGPVRKVYRGRPKK